MIGRPILTGAQMRAAEEAAIGAGSSIEALMERAGAAVAQAARRFAGDADTLILCGPGNNGGDGYVAARVLAAAGIRVRVAALGEPATQAAAKACAAWTGDVVPFAQAAPAALLIDALFGTGLKSGLEATANKLFLHLAAAARHTIAVDVPSGVGSDDGALLSPVPRFDLTVALGALKPAHLLQPAAASAGRLVVADIGVACSSTLFELSKPALPGPGPADHKYTRGLVTVIAGAMPGAARLVAKGAARSGAGYVQLIGRADTALPDAIVVRCVEPGKLAHVLGDSRIGALVVGPGLGRDARGSELLARALGFARPLVLDADALWHLGDAKIAVPAILTPHDGEFLTLFGDLPGDKVARVRQAARRCGAVVVLKGADTVIAASDGRAAIAPPGAPGLATAGTGDVLAGVCGTLLAQLGDPFAAACAAVWLHGRAAHALADPFVADDLAAALPAQVALCR